MTVLSRRRLLATTGAAVTGAMLARLPALAQGGYATQTIEAQSWWNGPVGGGGYQDSGAKRHEGVGAYPLIVG